MEKKIVIEPNILKNLVYSSHSHDEIAKIFKCSKTTVEREIRRQHLQFRQLSGVARSCRYLSKSGEKITFLDGMYFIGGHEMSGDEIISYANDLKNAEKRHFIDE